MDTVKVNKDELISKLLRNRAGHRAIFEEALAGYRNTVIAALEQHLAEVKSGRVTTIVVNLPEPSDHTKDYDRVIAMCEMSVDDVLELDQLEFGQYVMDDWSWRRQFLASNAAYSQTATRMLGS